MKTHKNVRQAVAGIFSLCLLFGLAACSDFLDEEPKSSFATGQYFAKPDHARAAVNALYRRGFPELYNAGSAYAGPNIMLGGYISGFFDNEKKDQEQYVTRCQELNITPQNEVGGRMNDVWDPCYNAISRANTAIKYIPETPDLSDAEVKYLLAQAKFFRALNYFHLVKSFGDVPLIKEPYESLENLYVGRTPSAEVYALIEADLKEAVADGGLKDVGFTDDGDFRFRVTKSTANALLANVYLQWSGYPLQANRYADAAAAAKVVINGGKHDLEQNGASDAESAYNKLRKNDKSKEVVYAVEYNAGISDGGWWPSYSATEAMVGKKGSDGENLFKWAIMENVYGVGDDLYNAYDATDLRGKERQFFYTSYTYSNRPGNDTTIVFSNRCSWFFFEDAAMLQGDKPGKDKPVIRYAEVLLTAAEAIAQSEGVASAEEYLNKVRTRAGLPGVSGLSKDAFIEAVWAERLREFPLEFKVWDDIQRTRKYPQTNAANKGTVTWVDVIGATNPWGKKFEAKHLLWPISANEVQRNPSLTNPGY
ncbi:MAG: RagB/SusD family nutrient uptake outer membrane protein [Prevotellaceae bacterium]|jgi:hypothetical protein|nr:RagB/SusD family nutrient uptake outer membrane protein [Prevotellaceae bacterium]